MTNAKVAIELYVDDKGTLRIKQFATDSEQSFKKVEQAGTGAAGKIQGAWESVKGAWVGVLAGLMAVREAWDLMNTAAKAKQEKQSFEALAASYGSSGKQILASLKEVSQGTVDTMTLVRNAGTAMMMGISSEDTVALMKVATATAKMTGQTTVKAFEDITLAVGRQSKMILDNLGIIVDVGKANEAYAKKLNIVGRELTDTEKKQAFMNATLKAGDDLMDKMGNQSGTVADKFQRFTATINNIKVAIGDLLVRGFYFLEGTFTSVAAASLLVSGGIFEIIGSIAKLTDWLHISSGAAAEWKMNADAAFGAAGELVAKADQSFKDMKSSNDAIIQGQANYTRKIQETTKAIKEQEKAEKKILALHKKEEAQKAQTAKEMYEELGQGAEGYFSAEATELVKKAAKWKEAGAETLAVEEWLYDQLGLLSDQAWEKQETTAGLAMDSLQAQSRTLVDEMITTTQASLDQLDAMGLKIEGLDGSAFTVYASMDGSGIASTVDSLIVKFQQLATVAASAGSTGGAGSANEGSGDTFKPDLEWQAQMVANAPTSNTTININQQQSRSDVNAIITETNRQEVRS
jgi:hypothetical protein